MKVLVLCDRYPWPLTNGQNVRIYHYVRQLSAAHEFHLACYADSPVPDEIRPLFASIRTFARPISTEGRGLRRLIEAFDVTKFIPSSPEAKEFLATQVKASRFDLVWVSGWDFNVNLPHKLDVPVLADAVDDGVLEYWREFKLERNPVHKLRLLKWVAMNALFERRYFGPAARALFVSDLDAKVFAKVCPGTPVSVVNIGVEEDFFAPRPGLPDRNHIVFVGNISFAPNADGLLYFVRDVLPRIRSRIPDVRLSIVGRDPLPEIRALAGPQVEITGFVDDVRPYIERASIFICPLRKGAGMKIKILQAWSMGKAVVASGVSVGGLRWEEGVNIVVRDDAPAFAEAVIDLLQNPARARQLGDAARSTVLEHYTWARTAGELESIMVQLVGGQVG